MTTRTTTKTGNAVGGIILGGLDASVIRAELNAMTPDGTVTSIIIDSATRTGLAKVETVAGSTRYPFALADGRITFRGLSRRFTI